MSSIFLLFFSIELGEAAQVVLKLVVLGIGCQATCTLHHKTAENGQHEDAEGEIQCPGTAAVEDEIYDSGTEDKDIGNPLIDAQGSLIVHSVGITVLRRIILTVNILFYCRIHVFCKMKDTLFCDAKIQKKGNILYIQTIYLHFNMHKQQPL